MKRLIIGLAIVVVILAVILGPYASWKYFASTRAVVQDRVRESASDAIIIKMAQQELAGIQRKIQEAKARIIEIDGKLKRRKQYVEQGQTALAEERSILQRAEKMLGQKKESYQIAGKTYSGRELVDDVNQRVAQYKALHERVESTKRANSVLENIKAEGSQRIREGELSLMRKQNELDTLKIRLANAKVAKEIRLIHDSIVNIVPDEKTMGFDELARRVAISESEITGLGGVGASGLIDWSGSDSGKAALEQIRALPGWTKESPATAPATRTSTK